MDEVGLFTAIWFLMTIYTILIVMAIESVKAKMEKYHSSKEV